MNMNVYSKYVTVYTDSHGITHITLSGTFAYIWRVDTYVYDAYVSWDNNGVSIKGTRLGVYSASESFIIKDDSFIKNYTSIDGSPVPTYKKKSIFGKERLFVKEGVYIKKKEQYSYYSSTTYEIEEFSSK